MIGINKCVSIKVCLLLTWPQLSWKLFEAYIWDGSEQKLYFSLNWKFFLDSSNFISSGKIALLVVLFFFRWDFVHLCKLWCFFKKSCLKQLLVDLQNFVWWPFFKQNINYWLLSTLACWTQRLMFVLFEKPVLIVI